MVHILHYSPTGSRACQEEPHNNLERVSSLVANKQHLADYRGQYLTFARQKQRDATNIMSARTFSAFFSFPRLFLFLHRSYSFRSFNTFSKRVVRWGILEWYSFVNLSKPVPSTLKLFESVSMVELVFSSLDSRAVRSDPSFLSLAWILRLLSMVARLTSATRWPCR